MLKRATDSQVEQVYIIRPSHLNGANRLYGGQLTYWIDEIAGVVAIRHSGNRVVTAAIDNLQFKEPVLQGQMVVMLGKVTYVGKTSMEVRVDSYVEDRSGSRKLINTAFLVMIAIGEDGKPAQVPGLQCETAQEQCEFEAGKRRRELRLRMNRELYDDHCNLLPDGPATL